MASVDLSPAEWDGIRDRVRSIVCARHRHHLPGLSLRTIDERMLVAAGRWRDRPYPHWDWRRLLRSESRRRMEMAAWIDERPCALALGPVTSEAITLARMERDLAGDNPLKGWAARLAIECVELQALALDVPETRIAWPVSALLSFYAELGYTRRVLRGWEVEYVSRRE